MTEHNAFVASWIWFILSLIFDAFFLCFVFKNSRKLMFYRMEAVVNIYFFFVDVSLMLEQCYWVYFILSYIIFLDLRHYLLNCTYRTLGKLPLQSGSCPWLKLKGTWKMFLRTSRPFHSDVSVVVLEGQLKQRIDTLMAKEGGLSSQQNSSLICSKMLRAMLKYVYIYFFLLFHMAISCQLFPN